jgi:hypothetical protein
MAAKSRGAQHFGILHIPAQRTGNLLLIAFSIVGRFHPELNEHHSDPTGLGQMLGVKNVG